MPITPYTEDETRAMFVLTDPELQQLILDDQLHDLEYNGRAVFDAEEVNRLRLIKSHQQLLCCWCRG